MPTRKNTRNDNIITFDWLEKETTEHTSPYFVIEGYYDSWDNQRGEISPSLEDILNYMYQKGFQLVSNSLTEYPNCKELVFMQL